MLHRDSQLMYCKSAFWESQLYIIQIIMLQMLFFQKGFHTIYFKYLEHSILNITTIQNV
uniref:Uncharacterized protein n=1 Tax=Anguilla anguilla TaxID=7936 RepID=A0A0E9XJ88_ANGAN